MATSGEPPIPMAKTVDPKDNEVIQIAKIAVQNYNENAKAHLGFISVEFGFQWSIANATYYMLAINTQDDKGTYRDVALVCDLQVTNDHNYKLIWYNYKNK